MTAVSTRDALAKALAEAFDEWLHRMHGITSSCRHEVEGAAIADALLASSAVIDAAALADDEALVWAVARNDYDMHAGDGARDFDDDWVTQAEQTLRALATALTERGESR
jgi:hypothetical protein